MPGEVPRLLRDWNRLLGAAEAETFAFSVEWTATLRKGLGHELRDLLRLRTDHRRPRTTRLYVV
jgi:hypothetical protein